jgi:hypothetical protein
MDEEDILNNHCADLVSLAKLEPALVYLLGERPPGAWSAVRELYARAGQPNEAIKADLVAAWLSPPNGDADGAVILFYDEESLWSMTAWYNVGRLRENRPEMSVAVTG